MSENIAAEKKENESGKTVLRAVTFGGFNRADVLDFIEKQKKVEADLKRRIEDLTAKLESAGKAAPADDGAAAAAREEAEEAKKEAENAKREAAALKARCAELESELAGLREAANKGVPAVSAEDAAKVAALESALDVAKAEKAALKNALAEKEVSLQQYAAAPAGNAAKVAALEKALDEAKAEKAELENALAEKESMLQQYVSAIAEKDAKISELTEKLAKPAATISAEAQIGAVLIDARRCADEIVATAKLEESRIRAQAYGSVLKTQKTVQSICDELEISFDRYKRNAELAKSTMDELNASVDEKLKELAAANSGDSVE